MKVLIFDRIGDTIKNIEWRKSLKSNKNVAALSSSNISDHEHAINLGVEHVETFEETPSAHITNQSSFNVG